MAPVTAARELGNAPGASRYARFAGVWSVATFIKGTVDNIAVGRLLGATAVGFYSVAFRLATSADSLISYVILKAMFPAFASIQQDPEAFRRTFLQHVQRMLLIVLPVSLFLAIAAEPIVLTLLGQNGSRSSRRSGSSRSPASSAPSARRRALSSAAPGTPNWRCGTWLRT